MPEIKMMREDGRNCPIIRCDACREMIVDAKTAVAVWPEIKVEGQDRQVAYAHKGICHDVIDLAWGKPKCPWDELSTHIQRLMFNLGIGSLLTADAKYSMDLRQALR